MNHSFETHTALILNIRFPSLPKHCCLIVFFFIIYCKSETQTKKNMESVIK